MPYINGKHVTLDEWREAYPPQGRWTSVNSGDGPPPPIVAASDISREFVPPKGRQTKAAKAAVKAATGVDVDVAAEPTLQFAELDADTEDLA